MDKAMTDVWLIPGINARLIELHALSGEHALTMAQIADKLSFEFEVELGRNAIIGRCHRLGLPMRPAVPFVHRKTPQAKRIRVRVEAPIEPAFAEALAGQAGLTIHQLREGVCRWPLGEVNDTPPYVYCGEATEYGCSWCPAHFDKAHPRVRAAGA